MVRLDSLHQGAIEAQKSRLNEATVVHHMATMDDAEPVLVYEHGDERILVNGYHRAEAARRLGRTEIMAVVEPGTAADAVRYLDLRT